MDTFKYVLSDTAILWWNAVIASGNIPGTINEQKDLLYTKFRVSKTRQELKRDIKECKYVPGVSCLSMTNKFQEICRNLDLQRAVQIEKFIKVLSPNLHQFVVSRNTDGFNAIKLSVKTY